MRGGNLEGSNWDTQKRRFGGGWNKYCKFCDQIITYFFMAFVHTRMAKYKPMGENTPKPWVWIGE